MEEVKSLAKWWNSEVVVPSLSTSLCMVSGPGALPLLRNLTNLMRVWASTSTTSPNNKSVVIWVLRMIKISIIILDEFVDFIKVIRIKMIAFYNEMSLNRFGKELCFVSVSLGDFVHVAQSWIIALTLWLKEVLDFAPRLVGVGL